MVIRSSAAKSLWASVVLPAPDGEDSTNNSPRRATVALAAFLFNVLNLFAHLVDHGFEVQANSGQARIIGLGTQCIGFAVKLLGQKVKLATHGFSGLEQHAGSGNMHR